MSHRVYLPANLQEKVAQFPEYRMGAHKVALVMKNGQVIEEVLVAWGDEIVRVGIETEINFSTNDILDVLDRS